MLHAIPHPLVTAWFDWYCRYSLRKYFHTVRLLESAPAFDSTVSTLYVANHSSFWDGILLNHLIRRHRRQPVYCMIDEAQVREHPFFRRVGGFSVDRNRPRDGMRSIAYAADLLNGSPCAVVIFPQGKIEGNDKRPLGFEKGIERLLKRASHVNVIAVALRYEFWLDQRAEALIALMAMDHAVLEATAIEAAVTAGLDRLRTAGMQRREGQILLAGRRSISQWKMTLPGRR